MSFVPLSLEHVVDPTAKDGVDGRAQLHSFAAEIMKGGVWAIGVFDSIETICRALPCLRGSLGT